MIGKTVSALKKHGSEQIRIRARALVNKWKRVADVWLVAQTTEGATDMVSKEAKGFHARTDEDKPNKGLIPKEHKQVENKTAFLQKPKRIVLKIKGKPSDAIELEEQSDKDLIQKKPFVQEEKPNGVDEAKKLQAAAKRLRDNYQQAENAKRQRRIQVLEMDNLPIKALGHRNAYIKSKGFATRMPLGCK